MSSMLDALTGGGGPPPGGPPPGGPSPYDLDQGPPGPPDQGPPGQGGDYSDSMQALDVAEDALHAFIQMDPDEVDRAQARAILESQRTGLREALRRAVQECYGAAAPSPGWPRGCASRPTTSRTCCRSRRSSPRSARPAVTPRASR